MIWSISLSRRAADPHQTNWILFYNRQMPDVLILLQRIGFNTSHHTLGQYLIPPFPLHCIMDHFRLNLSLFAKFNWLVSARKWIYWSYWKQLYFALICTCWSVTRVSIFFPAVVPNSTKVADEEKKFHDCADLYQAGIMKNGVYTIQISSQETKKVRNLPVLPPVRWCIIKTLAFHHFFVASRGAFRDCLRAEVRLDSEGADECEWRVQTAAGILILGAKNTLGSSVCAVRWETLTLKRAASVDCSDKCLFETDYNQCNEINTS